MNEENIGTPAAGESDGKKKSVFRELLEMIVYMACVAVLAFFLYNYVGQQVEVEGYSMLNALNNGEHLILEKVSYRFSDPERFDIIVFRPYEDQKDTYYIKRIIGLPGETIQIVDSDIYIDGELLEENFGNEMIAYAGMAEEPVVLGEGEYFVLGDNRNNSIDSRDERVGIVSRDAIMGRAWVRLWPINKMGVLSHRQEG